MIFLGLFFFTQLNSSAIHPKYCMYQYFIPFYCWVVFHAIDTLVCLTIHLLKDIWVVPTFLAIMNKEVIYIYVQVFV